MSTLGRAHLPGARGGWQAEATSVFIAWPVTWESHFAGSFLLTVTWVGILRRPHRCVPASVRNETEPWPDAPGIGEPPLKPRRGRRPSCPR